MHVYMFGICIYRGSSDLLDAQFLSAPGAPLWPTGVGGAVTEPSAASSGLSALGAPLWPTGVGGVVAVEREYTVKIK